MQNYFKYFIIFMQVRGSDTWAGRPKCFVLIRKDSSVNLSSGG